MATDARTPELPSRGRLSPRRRRLRITAAVLVCAAALGGLTGGVLYWKSRPAAYRSDEHSADITSALSRNVPAEAPPPRLADVTATAGLSHFRCFVGDRTSQLPEDMGPGLAWGDYDNDGDEDLFVVSAGGPMTAPAEKLGASELFRNLGDGRFERVQNFPSVRIHGMGAAWGDYDGDGYLDLAVSGYDALLLLHNEHGTGEFTRQAAFEDRRGFWSGVAWGDYDRDRRLDLYVSGYVQYTATEADRARSSDQLGTFVPYTLNPSSYQPALNLLFHNEGGGRFSEVAALLGVTNPTGRSLGALWHDFDDDGWPDLYVANDVSDNAFFRNTGGQFEDISHAAWVADYRSAMGLAAGDYNRDGDDDLYITHWVAQENALYDSLLVDLKMKQPVTASTNTSRTPPPPVRFMDVNEMRGLGQVALPFVGWGTEFADFDCDGWLDLVVANGSTLELEGPVPRKLKPQPAFLFWNQRGEFFHDLAPLNNSLSAPHVSRGLAVADYDNDGRLDFAMTHLDAGVQLLHNEMTTGHWLKLRLRSLDANGAPLGFADGARVVAFLSGATLRRTVSSASYLSQRSRIVHLGLGSATQVERLEVRWPGGTTNRYSNLQADATWELVEEFGAPRLVESKPRTIEAATAAPTAVSATQSDQKAQLVEFWKRQRAAMNALKVEKDIATAAQLLGAALEINPAHEDSRYYLGNCLAMQGDWAGALQQLQELIKINPQSHRGHAQWGTLRAISAQTHADLAAAEQSLITAHELNPEETGALLVLGEVALMRNDTRLADERLSKACHTNPKAVAGFFLRGYIAWRLGNQNSSRDFLEKTRGALGKEWQPKGATSEGDVRQKWHVEKTPLSRFWEGWDGVAEPDKTYAALHAYLRGWESNSGAR